MNRISSKPFMTYDGRIRRSVTTESRKKKKKTPESPWYWHRVRSRSLEIQIGARDALSNRVDGFVEDLRFEFYGRPCCIECAGSFSRWNSGRTG
ncbi:hypothetical protein GWI33_013547 [Rhynchophorus ferrugineus]|uniref:Uncharacterized protein n=1 Tax=Rhynchophorus ferrugineus TaxID=354439 RepID=A0A834M9V4_RHYFE|nr:hypothetical protein GWI33_013547 [Rhynchophorus ferrugineus]